MQLDAPITTTQTQAEAMCTDITANTIAAFPVIERPYEGGSSGNSNDNNNNEVMIQDEMGHNSDPFNTDSTNSNNKYSPGTASYIAKITGYISKTINTDNINNNNTMNIQYIYVNNRPVDLPKINRLLNEIWLKYTLKSRTSISYILNFTLPTHTYDVNMSPNKREIVLLYEVDIINWMRITINRLYSETTHGVFLMNNNNLNNYDMLGNKGSSSDNMFDFKNSNKDNVHNATPNISSHPTTTTTCTDVAYTNTSATTDTSTALQPTSSTSQPTAECLLVENNNNNINLSSQITIQNTDCDLDNDKSVNVINFDLNSPHIPRLNQSAAHREGSGDLTDLTQSASGRSGGGDVITDLTHLTHIDLIRDIDIEEYNNNEYENNGGIDEDVDDVYTSNNDDINDNKGKNSMSSDKAFLNTELPLSSSSSSSVVWMDEPEVIIMTPPTESISTHIHPSADEAASYQSNNSNDNNTVGEKRKYSYNNTDENSNTTAHKSIRLYDNNSTSYNSIDDTSTSHTDTRANKSIKLIDSISNCIPAPTSSSSSSYPTIREIWANCHLTYANNNSIDNSSNSSGINAYTNSILKSCTDNTTSLLHYINTHTAHTTLNTGYTHSHFSTLEFWFPDTTDTTNNTDTATHTDSLYNNNDAYTANNTAHIATGSTEAVVADIMALFSATFATTDATTTAHNDATATTNGTSFDMTIIPIDEEQGVTAATSEEGVTAATSAVAREPLYTLKTISKKVCKYILPYNKLCFYLSDS